MIVEKEDQFAEGCELVGKHARELRKAPFETATPIQERREVLAEVEGVAADGTDKIGEEHEGILVPTLQGEPRRAPARGAQEVGVLREERRLPETGGRVYERQPMTLRAFEPVEQALPPEKRKRQRRRRVTSAIGSALREGQSALRMHSDRAEEGGGPVAKDETAGIDAG
jgi:hypothetical protein